jgi:hypothetical protein
MPRATANLQFAEQKELKSCPGGFVTLRRLSYGQILDRRSLMAGMKVRGGKGKEFEGELQTMSERVTIYEYQNCVVDHNLEDEHGTKLDLHNPMHIKSLDPKVGQEIEGLLSELNNFEDDDEEGNFSNGSGTTSPPSEPVE